MALRPEEFDFLATMLKSRSGLSLTPDKVYLIESRLLNLIKSTGTNDLAGLIGRLRTTNDKTIENEIVQAMTVNESMFFRDTKPFEQIRKTVLPMILQANATKKHIRIWSAACSSGQEPYSLAICLLEDAAKYPGVTFEIVATDLSLKILEKAKSGQYTQFEVQRGLPIQMLIKYFTQKEGNMWEVQPKLKSMVRFEPHNLMQDGMRFGKFDIILCRNVLIYFDEATKSGVLNRMASQMNPPGVLFLGSAETVLGLTEKFKPMENERGVYLLTQ